jgi:hypothetical protein
MDYFLGTLPKTRYEDDQESHLKHRNTKKLAEEDSMALLAQNRVNPSQRSWNSCRSEVRRPELHS